MRRIYCLIRIFLLRILICCSMFFGPVLLGFGAIEGFFDVTETGWHAPEPDVIYLEPRRTMRQKMFPLIMGIGCFVALTMGYILNRKNFWKEWLDILEGKYDPPEWRAGTGLPPNQPRWTEWGD